MDRVAVVLVTYNSAGAIGECLDALRALPDLEVVVVDNASSDTTREEVNRRGVRLIANPENRGFAAAVNQGVRATVSPLVLLLNPDTRPLRGIDALAALFSNPKTGAAGGVLLGDDGHPQAGFMARNLPRPVTLVFEVLGLNRLFPRNPVNWHYRCLGLSVTSPVRVDQPAGAFLMFSRQAWETVGGFDERFFPIWFEDVDFCARLKASGFHVWFHPDAVARHHGAHSISSLPVEIRERYWYGSLLGYAAKHYRPAAFRVVASAVALGALFRAVFRLPRYGRKAVEVYGSVGLLAAKRVVRGSAAESLK